MEPRTRLFTVALVLCLASVAPRVRAQDVAAPPAESEVLAPEWRVDIDLPAAGAVYWAAGTESGLPPALTVGGWFTHRSGHGAMLRVASLFYAVYSYGLGAIGVEAAYQYAFTLAGDLRSGLSLAPYVGLFGGAVVGSGGGGGPLAGVNLNGRVWGFDIGLDVSYRAVFSQSPFAEESSSVQSSHGIAAMLRVGFGFWGS